MKTYRKHLKSKCEKCGEDNIWLLEVHHKDKNRQNNSVENLITLCCNCHRLAHIERFSLDPEKDVPLVKVAGDEVVVLFPRPLDMKMGNALILLLGSSEGNRIMVDDKDRIIGLVITKKEFDKTFRGKAA